MDVKFLKKLIRMVEQSQINELEIEDSGTRVKIVKSQIPASGSNVVTNPGSYNIVTPQADAPGSESTTNEPAKDSPSSPPTEKAIDKSNLIEITSPMVGTFYRAPSPGAPPFVEVGDRVEVGQTLCILEAMKLMNELESEVAGIVREICVENAQPIEFGQRLFLIEPEGK